MAKKTIPVNNYNDSDNYGTSGAAPSLYSDKHYLDGDGFLYGLGMASQRQIVKGKNDDITTKYFYWSAGKSTASKLGLNIPAIAGDLAGAGLYPSAGKLNLMFYTKKNGNVNESGLIIPEESSSYASGLKINTGKALSIGVDSTDAAAYHKLNVNVGQGLYIGTNNQHSATYNKININFFKKNITIDGNASLFNTSGLELVTGTADATGAPAAGQLRIKLAEMGSGTSFSNVSGLVLKDPASVEGMSGIYATEGLAINYGPGLTLNNSLQLDLNLYKKKNGNVNESGLIIANNSTTYTNGLKINYGTGLKLNTNGQLVVDNTAIVPNIFPSNSITIDESGNNKTIKVKLRPTADGVYDWSGLKVYDTADTDGGIGLSIDINRSTHGDNPLDIDTGGLFVDWERMISNFASSSGGNLSYYTDGNGHFGISVVPGQGLKNNSQSKNLEVKPKPNSGIGVDSNGVYLKMASTSEIGGVKLGTPATIQGANPVNLPLFLDSNNVGNVRMYVFNSEAPSNPEAANLPYSASYIDTNYSTKTEVTAEIASAVSDISGREYKIFPTLPTKGESQSWADFYAAYKKYIALVSNTGSEPDAYKEYILIVTNESTGECHWEQIGDTEFTTDNFVAKTDVLTQAEVASIVQNVFGF